MPCSRMSASLAPHCFPAWAGFFRRTCVLAAQSGTSCAANKGHKESLWSRYVIAFSRLPLGAGIESHQYHWRRIDATPASRKWAGRTPASSSFSSLGI